jgi:molybdate transport system ATP-binding protein
MQHITLLLSNAYPKQQLIQNLLEQRISGPLAGFAQAGTLLFSSYAIQQLLDEEARHERSGIEAPRAQTFRSLSSGEQKKALLQHLLQQQPPVLVLDNPFDNLDTAAQEELKQLLQQAAFKTRLVLLIHRRTHALPFIEQRYQLGADGSLLPFEAATEESTTGFDAAIPPPIVPNAVTDPELVVFCNVSVSYNGRPVLQQINWTIRLGEFWQLKGANGSGKTTLLTMINGDNVKGYGQELYLFGRKKGSGETVWEIKEKIGYLTPSMTDLFVTQHTLEEMILSGFKDSIGLYTQPTDLERRTAFDWLQWLGLAHKAKRLFRLLSSGEQRMALIARAMVKHPPLLLLDEPLMGLDEANAQKVIALINRLAAESRSALVYVSHQQEPGLQPQLVLELRKTPNGSVGRVIVC